MADIKVSIGSTPSVQASTGGAAYLGKGDPGVGIEDIAFVREDAEGNVYRIYLTDGTSYYFTAPKGAEGEPGKNGEPGKDGTDGKDGAPGAPGTPGTDGKDGKDGTNGITPSIGDNGNWFIGDTDTGKPSRGEPGESGTTDHSQLTNRNAADAHPMSAITGLEEAIEEAKSSTD